MFDGVERKCCWSRETTGRVGDTLGKERRYSLGNFGPRYPPTKTQLTPLKTRILISTVNVWGNSADPGDWGFYVHVENFTVED